MFGLRLSVTFSALVPIHRIYSSMLRRISFLGRGFTRCFSRGGKKEHQLIDENIKINNRNFKKKN